jgi:hypothetical protein
MLQSDRKSHATRITLFIDSCNLMQVYWINRHSIAAAVQGPTQVTSCSNLIAAARQLPFSSQRASVFAGALCIHCQQLPDITSLFNLPD